MWALGRVVSGGLLTGGTGCGGTNSIYWREKGATWKQPSSQHFACSNFQEPIELFPSHGGVWHCYWLLPIGFWFLGIYWNRQPWKPVNEVVQLYTLLCGFACNFGWAVTQNNLSHRFFFFCLSTPNKVQRPRSPSPNKQTPLHCYMVLAGQADIFSFLKKKKEKDNCPINL
jgi:hypothetical protein